GEIMIFGAPDTGVVDALRAISPQKEKPAMPETTTQETGADARQQMNEQALTAAREQAVQSERERVSEIQALSATAVKAGIDATVISEFIAKGISADAARKEVLNRIADAGGRGVPSGPGQKGPEFNPPSEHVTFDRDALTTRLACMQAAMLLRADAHYFLARRQD